MAWNPGFYGGYGSMGYMPQMSPQMPIQAPSNASMGAQGLSSASRMVSNREEANSVPADFTGSLMVFPDVRNNRVYIKRWNFQTGAADFVEFAPVVPEQTKETTSVRYATIDDLNNLRNELTGRKAVSKYDSDKSYYADDATASERKES